MFLFRVLYVAISHAGEYHPPSSDWGSVMLGAPTQNGLIGVDWNNQKGYVTEGDSIVHTWPLRDADFEYPEQYDEKTAYIAVGQAKAANAAIFLRQSGLRRFPVTEYAVVDTRTQVIRWQQMNCAVGPVKFYKQGGEVYMMDLGTGLVMRFDEDLNRCETVIDERPYFEANFCGSTWGEDLDGIKLWSFALTETGVLYYLTRRADTGDAIVGKFEAGVHSQVLTGLYGGSKNTGRHERVLHGYGDVFVYKDAVIVVTGEVDSVFGPSEAYAQGENLLGKVIKVERGRTTLVARGVRHAFSSVLVNSSLYVADVGAWCFDEITAVDVEGPEVNLMWPLEEGVAPGWNADAKKRAGVPKAPMVIFRHGCFACETALWYYIVPGAVTAVILAVQLFRLRAVWAPLGPLAWGFLAAAFYTPWFQKELTTYTHGIGLWKIDQKDDIGCSDHLVIAIVAGVHLAVVAFVISSKRRLAATLIATILAIVTASLVAVYRRDMTVAGTGQAPYDTDVAYGVYFFGVGGSLTCLAYLFDREVGF